MTPKAHLLCDLSFMGDSGSMVSRPVLAGSPRINGRVARASADVVEGSHEMQLVSHDDANSGSSTTAFACNEHIRRNGFWPYPCGQSPRTPTSPAELMEADGGPLAAQSAALFGSGAPRAEQIRTAATHAFFELDSDEGIRRAMSGLAQPLRGPFDPGQLVSYWRAHGTMTILCRL